MLDLRSSLISASVASVSSPNITSPFESIFGEPSPALPLLFSAPTPANAFALLCARQPDQDVAANSAEASLQVCQYDPLLQVLELLRGFLVIYCIAVVISTGMLCNRLASAKGLPQEP